MMDNKKEQNKDEAENDQPLQYEKNNEQPSTLKEKNKEDGLTEDDMEAEKKFQEAQTERD